MERQHRNPERTMSSGESSSNSSEFCCTKNQNDFSMLRQNKMLIVDLYREGDLKKKKGTSTLIGYVKIDIDQIASRHPVERWLVFPFENSGSKSRDKVQCGSSSETAHFYGNVNWRPDFCAGGNYFEAVSETITKNGHS